MTEPCVLATRPSFFREKILLGMSWREYLRALLTPGNGVAAVIQALVAPVAAVVVVGQRRQRTQGQQNAGRHPGK